MREAIVHLDDAQLETVGISGFVTAARDAGLRDVTELVCYGTGGTVLLQVASPIPAAELDRLESVEWWERLAASPSGVTYLCEIAATGVPEGLSVGEHDVTHDVTAVTDGGMDLSIVGSHEEIRRSVATLDEAGVNVLLQRLSDYRGRSTVLDALTDRQREILETAFSMGFYDVPRNASVGTVADAVGVDPSTVTEHLQRAERNLLAEILGTGSQGA